MASIWVLTQPTDTSKQEAILADVITGVRGSKTSVYAIRSDTRDLIPLVEWSTSFDKRDPLPAGFYISFLQTLDEAQRKNADQNRLIMAKWVIDQQEWQWLVQDIEDLAPREF
ncbi:hypothetical protein [Streptomyces sp. C10]|uniref:hypothetical protein n=1 Tax=Streptomyces sp. C10 TaxID=531941 RepID=UPI00397F5AF6